jgi:iron complex transport system substrate-binding protein
MFKKYGHSVLLFWLSIFVAVTISACNLQNPAPPISTDASLPPANCRIIKQPIEDICVPENPQRVVTLSVLGDALALGVKPVGSTTTEYWGDQFPAYLGNQLDGIEKLGNDEQPSLEKITALKPDLIIGWNDSHESIYPTLSRIAPTALSGWQPDRTWRNNFQFVTEVLGKQDAAQQAWDRYYQKIDQLKSALGKRYQSKTISIVFFYYGAFGADAKNSFAGSILEDAGLQRPPSQNVTAPYGYIRFSQEELDKIDGDVLFVMTFSENDEQLLQQSQQQPLWNRLKAVQQNQVYFVDQSIWQGYNLLAADAVVDDLFKYLVNTAPISLDR